MYYGRPSQSVVEGMSSRQSGNDFGNFFHLELNPRPPPTPLWASSQPNNSSLLKPSRPSTLNAPLPKSSHMPRPPPKAATAKPAMKNSLKAKSAAKPVALNDDMVRSTNAVEIIVTYFAFLPIFRSPRMFININIGGNSEIKFISATGRLRMFCIELYFRSPFFL